MAKLRFNKIPLLGANENTTFSCDVEGTKVQVKRKTFMRKTKNGHTAVIIIYIAYAFDCG